MRNDIAINAEFYVDKRGIVYLRYPSRKAISLHRRGKEIKIGLLGFDWGVKEILGAGHQGKRICSQDAQDILNGKNPIIR